MDELAVVYDSRYINNEGKFRRYAQLALSPRLANSADFEKFYASLHPDSTKNEFLRVTSHYLFFVKQGNWHVNVEGSNPLIEHFSNSFKLISLFSLIESLSNETHQDFYRWLYARKAQKVFPIDDKHRLAELYETYKRTYGSVRRCVSFFDQLPLPQQKVLLNAIQINGKSFDSIKEVAKFLYNLRSKFIHECRPITLLNQGNYLTIKSNEAILTRLSLPELLDVFECGMLHYFANKT